MSEFRCRYSSDLSVLLPATGNAKNAISWFPNLIGDRPMKGRKFIVCLLFLFSLFAGSAAFATEPPRPGEIEALKKSGEYQKRLDNVRALGNHRIDKDLLKQAIQRAKIQALRQQGLSTDAISEAPPTARVGLPTKGTPKIFAMVIDFTDYPVYSGNTTANLQSIIFGDGKVNGVLQNPFPYESLTNFYKRSS